MIKADGWKYPGAQVHTQNNVSLKFEVCGFRDTPDTNVRTVCVSTHNIEIPLAMPEC